MSLDLGPVRGRLRAAAPLAPTTWFRAGGVADCLFRPADAADLAAALAALPEDVPLTVLGAGSNVIVRDGGIPGLTVRLGGAFAGIETDAEGLVVGAACLDASVAEAAASAGLGGLEFLCGIPGAIGGAVAMNAGAYGGDVASVLDWAEIVTGAGVFRLEAASLRFGYRRAHLPPRGVVVRARLRATPSDKGLIAARMAEIRASRARTQPVKSRTGGSTFRNPAPEESPYKAWELIDAAGCRGLARGGARVSDLHCNFLINEGGATAAAIEGLGEEVRARVAAASGVSLQWEIRRLGLKAHA